MKRSLFLLLGMLVCTSAMSVRAEVPAFHMDEKKDAREDENTAENLYQTAENGIFSVELPKDWIVEYNDYDISAGKTAPDEIPFIDILPVTIERSIDAELVAWSDMVKERFQERLAGEPERVEYRVPDTDRVVEGLRFVVSSEDGEDTYTEFMTVEEIEEMHMTYFCMYLSGSYDDSRHEDETTYFEFLKVIDSMTLK